MNVKPIVQMDKDKLLYSMVVDKATTSIPKENVKDYVVQAVHSLCILQAKELLTYATSLQPDTEIPVHQIPQVVEASKAE